MTDDILANELGIKKENIIEIEKEMLNFFHTKIIPNIEIWNLIVKVNRKGVAIFDSLKDNFKDLISVEQIQSIQIQYYGERFKGKNVLLFDDSIGTGEQIEKEIEKIIKFKVETLSIATILANQDTVKNLKDKYPKIKFYFGKILDSQEYYSYFIHNMIGFFDYINIPLSSDLPIFRLNIPIKMSKKEIISLFSDKNHSLNEIDNFFDYSDRFKIAVLFIDLTKYNNTIKEIGSSIDNLKVRLFVRVSDSGTTIFIEYIAIPKGNMDYCKGNFDWCLKKQLNNITKLIHKKSDKLCLICVSRKLVSDIHTDFINVFDKKLSSKSIMYNLKSYEWTPFVDE